MKTRRGFFYTMLAVPAAWVTSKFVKPPKPVEISSDDLLFHSRPLADNMIFTFDDVEGKWKSREED